MKELASFVIYYGQLASLAKVSRRVAPPKHNLDRHYSPVRAEDIYGNRGLALQPQ